METAPKITIEGDTTRTVIITGDGNQVSLSAQGDFSYHLLDEAFRTEQGQRAPADFYNGTRPNWANIAKQHDAPRTMLDDLLKFVTDPNPPAQRVGIITGLQGKERPPS